MERQCSVCKQPFEPPRIGVNNRKSARKTCSKDCAKFLQSRRSGFLPQEVEAIKRKLEFHPVQEILDYLNRRARREGRKPHTLNSLKDFIWSELKSSIYPKYDNLSMSEFGRTLGVSHNRVSRWIRNGLPCKRYGRDASINFHQFGDWAKNHPQMLAGVDSASLKWVLEKHPDMNLILTLVAQYPKVSRKSKPVICAETGVQYPSISDAAKALYVNRVHFADYVKQGKPYNGRHYLLQEKRYG